MIIPHHDGETGSLRLRLLDCWTVRDFNEFLGRILAAYDMVERCETLFRVMAAEHSERDSTWTHLFSGNDRLFPYREPVWPPISDMLEAVAPFAAPLAIDAVKIASPGWLQVLGNLNPLKTIADCITDWRAENTKRTANHERSQIEREKIRAKLATDILKQFPQQHRMEGAHRLPEIVRTVIDPTSSVLQDVARDRRVESARIVRPGLPLPDRSDDSEES